MFGSGSGWLAMTIAAAFVVLLIVGSWLYVRLSERVSDWRRRRGRGGGH
jgi:hypothetical protein